MNQEELQQKIAEYYSKLPESLQRFFADMNWLNTLQEINTKYNLSSEQIETLSTETTLALLCIIPMSDYVNVIENNMKLSSEQKEQIMSEINDKIFKDIGYDLEDTFTKNVNDLSGEKYGGDKKLDERFSNLPKEVQDAIGQSDYQSKLYTISQNHKLNIEQTGILDEITTKVILNTIHPDQFENSLADKLNIGKDEVSKIVAEVNDNILKNIRETLKQNWGTSSKKEVVSSKEEDIPLPPYVNTSSKQEVVSSVQKTPNIIEEKILNPLEEKMKRPVSSTDTMPQQNQTSGVDPYRELV